MGGDHHDHHHKPKIDIPDYKTYKIEGIPQLEAIQKHLASKGLKDPWLRNEAWRYDPKIWGSDSVARHACRLLFRGFKLGFAAFVVTTSATVAYDKFVVGEDPHGGHGHH